MHGYYEVCGTASHKWRKTLLSACCGLLAFRTTHASAGGAIAARNASTVQIITSTFTENQAENGGAVYLEQCGKATLADNTFAANKANKQGGALFQTKCSGTRSGACMLWSLLMAWLSAPRRLRSSCADRNGRCCACSVSQYLLCLPADSGLHTAEQV